MSARGVFDRELLAARLQAVDFRRELIEPTPGPTRTPTAGCTTTPPHLAARPPAGFGDTPASPASANRLEAGELLNNETTPIRLAGRDRGLTEQRKGPSCQLPALYSPPGR
jgi:hypothetical protein